MHIYLEQGDYEALKERSKALDQIDKIINGEPEPDEYGNSMLYSYRFDKEISQIMDVLDKVRTQEQDRNGIKLPWVIRQSRLFT